VLLLFKYARINDTDHHQAGDNQGQSNECDKEDTTSASGEFTTDDPILK